MTTRRSATVSASLLALTVLAGIALTPPASALAPGITARMEPVNGPDPVVRPAPSGTLRPLLVVLHDAGRPSGAEWETVTGLTPLAAAEDWTVAYPSASPAAGRRWNAGTCCVRADAVAARDDVAYLRSVVARVSATVPVDPERVWVAGSSNGGMMAARLACQAPDVFRAAVVVSGALVTGCRTPVRLLHLHGLYDTTVPLAGGQAFEGFTFPAASTWHRLPPGSAGTARYGQYGHGWQAGNGPVLVAWLAALR